VLVVVAKRAGDRLQAHRAVGLLGHLPVVDPAQARAPAGFVEGNVAAAAANQLGAEGSVAVRQQRR
jgi:hypothetical protein